MRLVTDRRIVRDVAEDDATPLAALWSDPVVTRHVGGRRDPAAVAESVRRAAANPPALDSWSVEHDGVVIGSCGLLEKEIEGRDELEVVSVIATSSTGKGLATEAARAVCDHANGVLGRTRLVALVDPGNRASARVAEKLGFHVERDVLRPGGRLLRLFVREV